MNRLSRPHYFAVSAGGLALALLLGLPAPNAHARCIAILQAGFPHAHVQHYPANIRGVLFQAPADSALSADDFEIASTDAGRPLRGRIEPVALPADSAAMANLPRGTQLFRILIEGGYAPGGSYGIRYTAPRWLPMQYPDAISFTVDPAPAALTRDDVSLRAHPPEVRMHVVENEDIGTGMIAATRRLETRVASTLQPYRGAVSVFPEWADSENNGATHAYTPLRQRASACSGEAFGAGARERPDVVYQDCARPLGGKALQASAGFFEIDDRLHALPVLHVDWDATTQAACAAAVRKPLSHREALDAMQTGVLPRATTGSDGQ
ncbi:MULTISPECIES: hypothetical protein [unclassified Massilia]|uniref:hypothetical protein n=1 Tax=unclassified Massilia TaxID=2609279 RepID=UPI00177D2C93|nr:MULTISPECIES: hypothetical protein [unclassified Massilia]MBD8531083.1 hypothetical protein [Massilia sp. CFBP 13647]MBD8674783.1 hypothetical protein [Massilia sp. CFBP 13721]